MGQIVTFIKRLWEQIDEDEVFNMASTLAYFFLLSLFPLLIFLVTLLSYLPVTQQDLLGAIKDYAPGETLKLIETNLDEVMSKRNGGLLSFGIIATIWSASNGINAVVRAFNKAYNVKETRPFVVARGTAILLTFAMIFVFIVALLLPVFGKEIGIYLFSVFGLTEEFVMLWNMLRWLVSALILFIVFVGLYWIAPNKKIKCLSVVPGAIFATVGWILTSLAFSFYVSNFANYSATYGSIGAIIVLMVWLYLSAIIIIIGGEVNALNSKMKEGNC